METIAEQSIIDILRDIIQDEEKVKAFQEHFGGCQIYIPLKEKPKKDYSNIFKDFEAGLDFYTIAKKYNYSEFHVTRIYRRLISSKYKKTCTVKQLTLF